MDGNKTNYITDNDGDDKFTPNPWIWATFTKQNGK